MRIRLALFIKDEVYTERFSAYFSRYYGDKIELITYSEAQYVIKAIQRKRMDVLILDANTKMDFDADLFENLSALYLSDGYEDVFEQQDKVIKKYQKASQIYKLILNSVADIRKVNDFYGEGGNGGKTILFQSVSGGVGATSVSLALAYSLAKKGKSVLWLNLEELSSTNVFLNAEGDFGLEDVLFALKRRKGNLMLKIESCLKLSDGIYFLDPCKNAMDLISLKNEEIKELITTIAESSKFDYILIDKKLSLIGLEEWISMVDETIFVSDGTSVCNMKFVALQKAVKRLEEIQECELTSKCRVFYNRFSKKTSTSIESEIVTVGGLPKIETEGNLKELIQVMANEQGLENILK